MKVAFLSSAHELRQKELVIGTEVQIDFPGLTVGGVARNAFARLVNESATDALIVVNQTRIDWDRGGTAPATLAAS